MNRSEFPPTYFSRLGIRGCLISRVYPACVTEFCVKLSGRSYKKAGA